MAAQNVTITFSAPGAPQVENAINRIAIASTRAGAATTTLQQTVGSLGRGNLNSLSASLAQLDRTLTGLGNNGGLRALQAQLNGINASVGQLGRQVRSNSFNASDLLGPVAGYLSIREAIQGIVAASDSSVSIQNRLQLYSRDQANAAALLQANLGVANDTRVALEDQVRTYTRLQAATRDFAYTQQQLLDITSGINQAFAISGSVGAEASASIIQFTQAISSNRLGGDELRSISEQAPRLTQALVEGLNTIQAFGEGTQITIGDLRQLGTEGKLTSDVLLRAFQSQLPQLQAEFVNTSATISQALTIMKNNAINAFIEFDRNSGFVRGLSEAIIEFSKNLPAVIDLVTKLAGAFAAVTAARLIIGTITATSTALAVLRTQTAAVAAANLAATGTQVGFTTALRGTAIGAALTQGALLGVVGVLGLLITELATNKEKQENFALGSAYIWERFKRYAFSAIYAIIDALNGDLVSALGRFDTVLQERQALAAVRPIFDQQQNRRASERFAQTGGATDDTGLRGTIGGGGAPARLDQRLSTDPTRTPTGSGGRATRERGKTLEETLSLLQREQQALSRSTEERQVEEDTLRRVNSLRTSYNRDLDGEPARQIRAQVALNARIERFNDLIDVLDPISAAQREFQLDTNALTAALETGRITQDRYAEAVERLGVARRAALDPLGEFLRLQDQERQLLGLTVRDREIEQGVLEQLDALQLDYAANKNGPVAGAIREELRATNALQRSMERQQTIYEDLVQPARDYADVLGDIDAATQRFGLTTEQNLILRMTAAREVLEQNTTALSGLQLGLLDIREQSLDTASVMRDAFSGVFSDLEDQAASLFDEGTFDISGVLNNLQQQLGRFAFRSLSDAVFENTPLGGIVDQIIGGAGGQRAQDMTITATGTVNIGGSPLAGLLGGIAEGEGGNPLAVATQVGVDGLRGIFEDNQVKTSEVLQQHTSGLAGVFSQASDLLSGALSGLGGLFGGGSSKGGSGGGFGDLLASGIGMLFGGGGGGGLKGFANGGDFMVGGSGGTDSQLVAFRASPNERVTVTRPDQASGQRPVQVVMNIQTPDADSFQRSSTQIYARAGKAVQRAGKRAG